jgi:hypothetical protein
MDFKTTWRALGSGDERAAAHQPPRRWEASPHECLTRQLIRLITLPLATTLAATPKKLSTTAGKKIPVAIVLTERATVIDFAGPLGGVPGRQHPAANGALEEAFELYTVGISKAPIKTSGGLTAVTDDTFADTPAPNVVIVGVQGAKLRRCSHGRERPAGRTS